MRDGACAGLEISPDNPWLLNSLGVSLLNADDKKRAKETFEKALSELNLVLPQDWGRAYPGNDPGICSEGLSKM